MFVPMRVLCTCVPSTGRFQVLAPLAHAIADMGHNVAFAAPVSFQREVEASGFDTIVAGLSLPELRAAVPVRDRGLPPDQLAALMFMTIAPLALEPELRPLASAWSPDVILHEEGEYGGPLIGALIGVPTITVGWPAPLRPAAVLRRLHAALAETWTMAGASPRALGGIYDHLFFDTCPPSLQAAHATTISARQLLRPALDTVRPGDLPVSVSGLTPGVPTVHLTLGTVLSLEGDTLNLVRQVIDALRGEALRLIVSVGEGNDPKAVGTDSDSLIVVRYVPHRTLLPHCDAVICHGGAGSTIAALSHGLPLLILPRGGASQQRNAVACCQARVGLALQDAEITPSAIRSAVTTLLTVPEYRQGAQRIADEIRSMPAPDVVVPEIARVARARRSS